MSDTATIYLTMTAILGVMAVAWLFNGLSAFASWRTFRVRADLIWLVAFLLLGLVAGVRALEAYRWHNLVLADALSDAFVTLLGDVAIGSLRTTALEMVAAIATMFAFRARRVDLG